MAHRGDVRLYTQPWTRLLAQRRAEQRFHRGDRACGVRITRLLPGLSARGVRGAGVRRDPRPRDPARLAAHRGARAAPTREPHRPGAALAVVRVDQTTGGGLWRALGTWTFPAGWTRVVLPRRGAAGAVIVADAVRVRE